ncbi:MAG: TSUP family transporter [Chloroflexota bacterium]
MVISIAGTLVATGWLIGAPAGEQGTLLAAVLVALLAGVSVSVTGIFGGVLVPGLLLLGMDVRFVAALSLTLQVIVVPVGAFDHYRRGNIRSSIANPLIVGGALGAIAGAYLVTHLPAAIVEKSVALIIVIIGIVVLVRARPEPRSLRGDPSFRRIAGIGGAAGFASGISGAGWGPIGVKLLILSNIEARLAIGSSLVGRGFMAVAAIATYVVTTGFIFGASQDWLIAIPLLGAAVAGVGTGAFLITRLSRRPAMLTVAILSIALASPTLLKGIW